MTEALTTTLSRLETLIEGSIAAMQARQPIDDRALAEQKGRVLLELTRIGRRLGPVDDELATTMTRVRGKLAAEGDLLALRLAAAETIADLVSHTARLDEWDGTYTGPAGRSTGVMA